MAPSFVQINKGDFTSARGSFSVSLSSGTTSGNFVAVAGSFDRVATSVTVSNGGDAVTDSGLGTNDNTSVGKSFIVAFLNCVVGRTTFTATYSGTNPTFGDLYVWEISGLSNAVFDKKAVAQGSAATGDSGSTGTLSSPVEAGIAFGCTSGQFNSAGAGWTIGQGSTVGTNTGDGITTTTKSIGEHRIISAATTAINGTGGLVSGNWTMWVATFMAGPTPKVFGGFSGIVRRVRMLDYSS